jgi:hypothetical protein
MKQEIPIEYITLRDEIAKTLAKDFSIIRGRRNTFGWFLSTASEDEIIRKHRWIKNLQHEIKFVKALKERHGLNKRYLLFNEESPIDFNEPILQEKSIVPINITKAIKSTGIISKNLQLYSVENSVQMSTTKNLQYVDPNYLQQKELDSEELKKIGNNDFETENRKQLITSNITRKKIENKDDEPSLGINPEEFHIIPKDQLWNTIENADDLLLLDIFSPFVKKLLRSGTLKELAQNPENLENLENLQKELGELILIKTRIKEHLKNLDEFETLINTPDIEEEKLQNFLETHTWVFGEEYLGVLESKKNVSSKSDKNIPDFVLKDLVERKDAIYFSQPTIFELKRADVQILKEDSRKSNEVAPRANVLDAIWQAIRYVDKRNHRGFDSRAYIVIGGFSQEKETNKMLQTLNNHLSKVQITTYGNLLKKARRRLNSYLGKNTRI